jgi:hypothetical protein
MAYVKAFVSDRAKKYLATAEGRRMLLLYIVDGSKPLGPAPDPPSESTTGRTSPKPNK